MKGTVKARSWNELPETLKPGTYCVKDICVTVREEVSKEEVIMAAKGVKEITRIYYKK